MAEATCGRCGARLQFAREPAGGSRGQCPRCGGPLSFGSAGSEATPGAEDEDAGLEGTPATGVRPRPRTRARRVVRLAEWETARKGLTTVYWGLISTFIALVVAIGSMSCAVASATGGSKSGAQGLLVLAGLVSIGAIAGLITMIVGQCMCIAAPAESGTKGLATAAVLLVIFGGVLQIAGVASGAGGPRRGAVDTSPLAVIGILMGMGGNGCFLFFLRAVNRFFGNEKQARQVMHFFIYVVVCAVAYVGWLVLVGSQVGSLRDVQTLMMAGGIGTLVLGSLGFVWYLGIIRGTRNTILQGRRGADEAIGVFD